MVTLYKPQTQDTEDQIKANIKRFEQLTGSIAKKLADNNPLVKAAVPEELQQNNKFRDITLFKDYNTLVKVLKAVDSKPVDVYKQAIEMYKKQDQYANPQVLGNYVARFKQNLNNLIQKVNDKDEETLQLIPKQLLQQDAYKNILNWRKFHDLEVMLDSIFPLEATGDEDNNASAPGTDLIYEKDGIEIYKGDEEHKCIQYGKGYGWCIGKTMYPSYRYMQSNAKMNRMFYFIFDRNLPKSDKYHAVVLHAFAGGGYTRTTAVNGDETQPMSWEEMGSKLFSNTESGKVLWNKIKGLQNLFEFIPPNKDEQRRLGFRGVRKTLEEFIEMDSDDKRDWLRANATDRNIITSEIVRSLPADGEVSRNELINYNRAFTYDELKDSKQLLRRYAEYRYSRYSNDALPLIFIPYFKDDSKRRYYEQWKDKYATVELLDQFFGNEYVEEYLTKDAKKLWYIPEEYVERIPDPKLKTLYKTYFKLLQNWFYQAGTNDIDKLSNEASMPDQKINPLPILYNQWKELNNNERDTIMKLAKKSKPPQDDKDPNTVLYYAAPYIVDDKYVLLPIDPIQDDSYYYTWALSDVNGNLIKKLDIEEQGEDVKVGDSELVFCYPQQGESKVISLSDITLNGKPFVTSLKESEYIYEDWNKYSLMRKAGIIR